MTFHLTASPAGDGLATAQSMTTALDARGKTTSNPRWYNSWYIFPMTLYPSADDTLDALGDKVVQAIADAVDNARDDLAEYRAIQPGWVADHSERGLANWMHDRVWARLRATLDSVPGVILHESGPTREITVNDYVRVRIKRHDTAGNVTAYPTLASAEFFAQPTATSFEGMEQIHVVAGYRWLKDSRDVAEAVLSLRDGIDNIIWQVELSGRAPVSAAVPVPVSPLW